MKDYILSFAFLTSTLLAYSTLVYVQHKDSLRLRHHSSTSSAWESFRDPQSMKPVGTDTEAAEPQRATR